jgi:hypothetical protein
MSFEVKFFYEGEEASHSVEEIKQAVNRFLADKRKEYKKEYPKVYFEINSVFEGIAIWVYLNDKGSYPIHIANVKPCYLTSEKITELKRVFNLS